MGYTKDSVFVRAFYNRPKGFQINLGEFPSYEALKHYVIKEYNLYPQECYVSVSGLHLYQEGSNLLEAWERWELINKIDFDQLAIYHSNIKDLRYADNDELIEYFKIK